jgi:hypothetical protein
MCIHIVYGVFIIIWVFGEKLQLILKKFIEIENITVLLIFI